MVVRGFSPSGGLDPVGPLKLPLVYSKVPPKSQGLRRVAAADTPIFSEKHGDRSSDLDVSESTPCAGAVCKRRIPATWSNQATSKECSVVKGRLVSGGVPGLPFRIPSNGTFYKPLDGAR